MPAAAARASSRSSAPTRRAASASPSRSRRSRANAKEMLGNTLVTHPDRAGRQAGQPPLYRGRLRHRQASSTSRCWSTARPARVAFVVSTEGGMDIEEVAHDTPEKILTFSIDPATGVMPHHGRARRQGARASRATSPSRPATLLDQALHGLRRQGHGDAGDQPADRHRRTASCKCLDAKIGFDSNALYRHPDIVALRDETEEDAKEIEASQVRPRLHRARRRRSAAWSTAPASPWRPWTSSSSTAPSRPTSSTSAAAPPKEKVTAAFKIITADPNVKGILVNIFGGIMRCDVIAEGVIAAVKEVGPAGAAGGAPRRHQRRAGQEDHPRVAASTSSPPTTSTTPPQKIVKAVRGAKLRLMSILSTRTPRSSARASPARTAPSIPSRRSPTAPRWSAATSPGKGGSTAPRPAGVRHRRRGARSDRRRRLA